MRKEVCTLEISFSLSSNQNTVLLVNIHDVIIIYNNPCYANPIYVCNYLYAVSEDISHEAATIVHRQFGHSKRLAESEKKALVFCLCVETQKTQNIWRREISRTEKDIEYEKELNDYKDQTVKLMAQV